MFLMDDKRFENIDSFISNRLNSVDNRRVKPKVSRFVRFFTPYEENESIRSKTTSGVSSMANPKRDKMAAQARDFNGIYDEEKRPPSRMARRRTVIDNSWVGRLDERTGGSKLNLQTGMRHREDCQNNSYSENTSDSSESKSGDSMEVNVLGYEGNKGSATPKRPTIVEGGKSVEKRFLGRITHRVNADLDRYEKGAGVINYNIAVKKIMKNDNKVQVSREVKRPKKSPKQPNVSIPKNSTIKLPRTFLPWKPNPRWRSLDRRRESLIREASPSPKGARRISISNPARFSGKPNSSNAFSPSKNRHVSPLHTTNRTSPVTPPPSLSKKRYSSPPPQPRSHSVSSFKSPSRNSRGNGVFRRVTFADTSTESFEPRPASRRHEEDDTDDSNTTINRRSRIESAFRQQRPSSRAGRSPSPQRVSNQSYRGRRGSKSKAKQENFVDLNFKDYKGYQGFVVQDIDRSSGSFSEQLRNIALQEANNPFTVWDPDTSRWSRDLGASFESFTKPKKANFVARGPVEVGEEEEEEEGGEGEAEQEESSSGSLFTDEMEINPNRKLSSKERKVLFHSWDPIFYCNECFGQKKKNDKTKSRIIDPRYRLFH